VLGAVALTALLAVYVVVVATRGVALLQTGEPVGVVLGLGVLLLPLLAVGLVVREWMLAVAVQRMADDLAARGALPVDELPRRPSGRIDRAAARDAFEAARADAEANPEDWAARYRLGFAYDAAGDRRRARAALRLAARMRREARDEA
jgi:acyl-CoA synthetase (AMP-forming)/AMP-acid ligase II